MSWGALHLSHIVPLLTNYLKIQAAFLSYPIFKPTKPYMNKQIRMNLHNGSCRTVLNNYVWRWMSSSLNIWTPQTNWLSAKHPRILSILGLIWQCLKIWIWTGTVFSMLPKYIYFFFNSGDFLTEIKSRHMNNWCILTTVHFACGLDLSHIVPLLTNCLAPVSRRNLIYSSRACQNKTLFIASKDRSTHWENALMW